jgi:hypothetical protein
MYNTVCTLQFFVCVQTYSAHIMLGVNIICTLVIMELYGIITAIMKSCESYFFDRFCERLSNDKK